MFIDSSHSSKWDKPHFRLGYQCQHFTDWDAHPSCQVAGIGADILHPKLNWSIFVHWQSEASEFARVCRSSHMLWAIWKASPDGWNGPLTQDGALDIIVRRMVLWKKYLGFGEVLGGPQSHWFPFLIFLWTSMIPSMFPGFSLDRKFVGSKN